MTDVPDDLDKLLADVRKTISENKAFLEKLVDETETDSSEDNSEDDTEALTSEDEYEEL